MDQGWQSLLEGTAQYADALASSIEVASGRSNAPEPVRIAFKRSAPFLARQVRAAMLLAQGDHWSSACIVARTVLEVGVRLCWASTQDNGWGRYQARVVDHAASHGVSSMPDLATCMHDLVNWEQESQASGPVFEYTQVYRVLSGLSHGHLVMMGVPDDDRRAPLVTLALLKGLRGVREAAKYSISHDDPSVEEQERRLWDDHSETAATGLPD